MFLLFTFMGLAGAQDLSTQLPQEISNLPKIKIEDETLVPATELKNSKSGKSSSEESLLEMPNLNVAGGTNRLRYLQVRGLGETSVYENTPSHSVGLWIDNIDVTGWLASWPQQNVAQVNLQSGPQSVHDGGWSSAGALQTQLDDSDESSLQLITSSANEFQWGAQIKPFSKTHFFISAKKSDGFFKNDFTNQPGAEQNEISSSVQQTWWMSPQTKIRSTHLLQQSKNNYDIWSLNNSYVTQSDRPGKDDLTLHGHSLSIEKDLTNQTQLLSQTSLAIGQTLYSYDADWGNNAGWNSVPGWNQNYDYFDSSLRKRTQWHQKIFLNRKNTSVGVHLYGMEEDSALQNYKNGLLKNALESQFSSLNSALLAQKKWLLLRSQLSVDLRYEWQQLKYTDSQQVFQDETPQAWAHQVQWKTPLTQDSWWTTRWSRGFKNAGFNTDPDLTLIDRYYGLESTQAFEIEFANLEHRLIVFYQKQNDKQLKVSKQNDPSDPSSFLYLTTNAGKTDGWGLEYLGRWNFSRWHFEAQGGFLQTQFRTYQYENLNYRGRELAHAPRWNFATSARYNWSRQWSTVSTLHGRDEFYYSNNHAQKSDPYLFLNLGAEYIFKNGEVALWIKNLADTRSTVRGFYFANEPPDWQNKLYEQLGPPRHFVLSSTYRF